MKTTLEDQLRRIAPESPNFNLSAADKAAAVKRGRLDLRHLWHSLLEKLWIVLLCVVGGLFLGLAYYARTPNLYQGHIVLEVDVQDSSPLPNSDSSSRIRMLFLATQEAMRTIEQNLTNRSLLARVVKSENLTENGGKAILGDQALPLDSQSSNPPPAAKTAGADEAGFAPVFTPLEEALGAVLSKSVKPVIRRGTRLIDVYVTNYDPVMAQRLAEAVGREYIRQSVERRSSSSQETVRYLLEEEERLKKNLQKSEAAVAEYKAKTPDALQLGGGAAATGSQAGAGSTVSRGTVEEKLQELNSKLTAAKAERLRLEGELAQIDATGDNVDALLVFPSIASAPTVADRRKEVAQVQAVVAALSQRYKERHPKMLAAQAALNEAQANLKRAVLSQPAVLRNVRDQARATENNLAAAVQEQEKAAVALNRAAIGYQELARQAETDRALYESVLRQIKETDVSKGVKTNAVSIVEHSPVVRKPVSPSPVKAVGLGLLLGLAVGVGFVYLSDAMDRSVKTVDEAEALFNLPVVAAVPEVKKGDAPKSDEDGTAEAESTYRLVAEAPEGPAAEAFRNLRAALSLLGPEVDHKVSIFTSASPAEGKSFTSANYALALAQQGYDVLLIDGDLRRPTLHRIFQAAGTESGKTMVSEGHGIVDCLVGAVDLREAVRPVSSSRIGEVPALNGARQDNPDATQKGTLSLLAGGRRAPNPAELLSGNSFAQLVEEATNKFDRVVIDSAPILAVSDTLLMVPYVQNVCMVIRSGHSPRNTIQRSLRLLAGAGARPVGVVLNRLPRQRGASYYYYYASEGYGAGEGSYSNHYRPRVVDRKKSASRASSQRVG